MPDPGQVPRFVKTLPSGVDNHVHIVYLRKDGTGYTSELAGHMHFVEYVLPEPPQIDPVSGAIVRAPKDGFWRIIENEDHAHEIDEEFNKMKPFVAETDENKIVAEIITIFKHQVEHESQSRKMGMVSEGFYSGRGQWKSQDKQLLESKQRAALTINEIQSKVNMLTGFHSTNRSDITFLPIEGGDQKIADILNVVVKNIMDQNMIEQEENQVFEDEIIGGRGVFNTFIDFNKDARGEIMIERFKWSDLYASPHEKKDMSDCDCITKAKWFSLDKAMSKWPDKADELRKVFSFEQMTGDEKVPEAHLTVRGIQYTIQQNKIRIRGDKELMDIGKAQIRVMEQWRKIWFRADTLVNSTDDFAVNTEDWFPEDKAKALTIPGFKLVERVAFRMRVTVVAGNILITDVIPDIPIQDFFIAPAYAYKRGDNWWGVVEALQDPQKEINKRHSQAVDIGNKMAAFGWFFDRNTFPRPQDKAKFLKTSSSAGFSIEVNDSQRPPTMVQGVKFPNELVQLEILASQKMREISNIPESPTAIESGRKVIETRRTGLIGNDFLFDSLDMAKRKLGKLVLAQIQMIYTPERIIRIIENQMLNTRIMIGGNQMKGRLTPQDRAVIREILENNDLTRYDVAVDISPASPSRRRAIFNDWFQLALQGFPVPPELLVEYSDFTDKDRVISMFQASNQQQAELEQGKQRTEIVKTAIKAESTKSKVMAGSRANGGVARPPVPVTGR